MQVAFGVLGGVFVGCALAAVDLWGGVRALPFGPKGLVAMVVVSGTLIVVGALGWVKTFPAELRLVRSLQALGGAAVLACALGGGLFAYYAQRRLPSGRICASAECATTRAAWEAKLDEGLGPLFPVIDPGSPCLALERERRALVASGTCPHAVFDDTPCTCGTQAWDRRAPHCATGRTVCEYREERRAYALGCAQDTKAPTCGAAP